MSTCPSTPASRARHAAWTLRATVRTQHVLGASVYAIAESTGAGVDQIRTWIQDLA